MFKVLSGNKYMELLSTSNKMIMDQWKMHNGVQKEYDALAKTYIYNVGGKSPVAKLSLPKDKMQKLDLYYPLLVLHLYFPVKSNILFDIGVTCCNSQRRRITLSSNQKSKQKSLLATVLPFAIESVENWMLVLVDIEKIVSDVWSDAKFRGIDSLSLSGVFRLKRIFLLSRDLTCLTEGTYLIKYDQLPKQLLLPKSILGSFKYISSSSRNSLECLKEINLENISLPSTTSSRTSSRASFNGSYSQQEIKTVVSEKYGNSSVRQTLRELEPFVNPFQGFGLNLSSLSFSEKSNRENLNELFFNNSPNKGKNSSSEESSRETSSVLHTDGNVEVWMPFYHSDTF